MGSILSDYSYEPLRLSVAASVVQVAGNIPPGFSEDHATRLIEAPDGLAGDDGPVRFATERRLRLRPGCGRMRTDVAPLKISCQTATTAFCFSRHELGYRLTLAHDLGDT
jgi:hypothetical protein